MTSAQHSAQTVRHGTPPEVVGIAYRALEVIGLDPASDHQLNQWVGACRYLTAEQDATRTPWFAGGPRPLRVLESAPPDHLPETALCNPPGGLIKEFWYSLCSYWARGWISSAVWVGFSVEQLTYLQKTRAPAQPLQLPTLFPRRRLAYRTPAGEIAKSPPHASYLTLLTRDLAVHRRFVEAARNLGYVINAGDRTS